MTPVVACHTAGVRVDLVGADGAVLELVREVTADLIMDPTPDPLAITVEVRRVDLPPDADPEQVAARLIHAVHTAALRATPTLPVHAAALAGASGCVVLPGPSGAGKSTLAAAAMQRGLTLLSDEAACFTTPVGTVVPHTRPVKLSRHSRRLLGLSDPADPDNPNDADAELALAVAALGGTASAGSVHRCAAVVLPLREPGRTATLDPVGKADVLAALLRCRLRADAELWPPERAWAYLTDLVRRVRVAALRYDDPHQAADVLAEMLSSHPTPFPEE